MSARQQEQRSRMIEENIGLVHACAHRFKGKGIEYDDLFQAGCIGLVKATDAFDSERGVRFSTYAVPVILGEMRRLFRDGGTVKVSRSLKELSMKAARQRDQFAKEHGREPTVSELAQALQVSEEAVVEALGAGAPPVSLTSEEDSSQLDLPDNPKLLIDALRVIDDEMIDIYYMNPKAPCFIRDEAQTYIYLILPVNFVDND